MHVEFPRMVAAAMAVLVVAGCPEASEKGGPVEECQETGQQCRIEAGQLGVCTMQADGEFECVPQH